MLALSLPPILPVLGILSVGEGKHRTLALNAHASPPHLFQKGVPFTKEGRQVMVANTLLR